MSKVNSPFAAFQEEYIGVPTGDTNYYDRKIYDRYVETGVTSSIDDKTGEKKYSSIGSVKVISTVEKKDIMSLINSHADEVGIANLIKLYTRTGDASLFNARTPLPAGDYTNLPSESAEEIFKKIPAELVGDRSMEEFLKTLSKEQLIEYFKTLQVDKPEVKSEEVSSNE